MITYKGPTGLASIAQGDATKVPADSAFFKVVNIIDFEAPLDWVWKNCPFALDITKVMNDDPTHAHSTIGAMSQRTGPSADGKPFNEVGSHIFYKLVGGREVDEIVLQRDQQKLVYEYVYSLGFCSPQGHMLFEANGPTKTKMQWTYWVNPSSDEMKGKAKEFMDKVWGPFIVNHCTPNLKVAVDRLYAGDKSYGAIE